MTTAPSTTVSTTMSTTSYGAQQRGQPWPLDEPDDTDTAVRVEISADVDSCAALASTLRGLASRLSAFTASRTSALPALAGACQDLGDALDTYADTCRAVRRAQRTTTATDPEARARAHHAHATELGKARHALAIAARRVQQEVITDARLHSTPSPG